jgi:hypothetical protein
MHIGHAKIRIEKQHAAALQRAGCGEIHGKSGLADSAFAAGHRNRPHMLPRPEQFRTHRPDLPAFQKNAVVNPAESVIGASSGIDGAVSGCAVGK